MESLDSVEQRYAEYERMLDEDRKRANTMAMSIADWIEMQEYSKSFHLQFLTIGVRRNTDVALVPLWRVQAMVNEMKHESAEEEQRFIDDLSELIEFGREWNHQMAVMRRWDEEVWTDDEDEENASESASTLSSSTVTSLNATKSSSSIESSPSSTSSNSKKKRKKAIHPMFKKKKRENKNLSEKHWCKMPRSNVQFSPPPGIPFSWR